MKHWNNDLNSRDKIQYYVLIDGRKSSFNNTLSMLLQFHWLLLTYLGHFAATDVTAAAEWSSRVTEPEKMIWGKSLLVILLLFLHLTMCLPLLFFILTLYTTSQLKYRSTAPRLSWTQDRCHFTTGMTFLSNWQNLYNLFKQKLVNCWEIIEFRIHCKIWKAN